MFPIQNRKGKIVAFGGRTLPGGGVTDHSDAPKYLNSPETEHFQKNQMLYGLFQALPTLRKTRRATVVEGLSCGFRMIVAEECVADRHESPHFASLYDMAVKYADVLPLCDVLQGLESMPR
jgi:hypothetical protein